MSKINQKTILIKDETLFGTFPVEDYQNCILMFQNCTFIKFQFRSQDSSIEFLNGNIFCETILLDASKVVMKEFINTKNLESLSINGRYFKMPKGMNIKAVGDISIKSDIHLFQNNKLESMTGITLQSSGGITVYQNCEFIGKYGVKISKLRGDLQIENCEIEVTESEIKERDDDNLNGVSISCYGKNSHFSLLDTNIKTDVLEVIHPNQVSIHNTNLYREKEYGRFLSRNQECPVQVFNYNYIEAETLLDTFYKSAIEGKKNKSKILELLGFKKSA